MNLRRQLLCKQERFVYRITLSTAISSFANILPKIAKFQAENKWIEGFVHMDDHVSAPQWIGYKAESINNATSAGCVQLMKIVTKIFGEISPYTTFVMACKSGNIRAVKFAAAFKLFESWYAQSGFAFAMLSDNIAIMVFLKRFHLEITQIRQYAVENRHLGEAL